MIAQNCYNISANVKLPFTPIPTTEIYTSEYSNRCSWPMQNPNNNKPGSKVVFVEWLYESEVGGRLDWIGGGGD